MGSGWLDFASHFFLPRSPMTFNELHLDPALLAALPAELHTPTRIQQLAIPAALKGQDLLALAQTGSGKTLAFGLPLLQGLNAASDRVQGLVLVPTRELATQVNAALQGVAEALGLRLLTLCGGVAQEQQQAELALGPQLLVATPGRLRDLLAQRLLGLSHLRTLVLDEADRLLEMGFWPDIQWLLNAMPTERQTLLFSATLPLELESLAIDLLTNPIRIEANPLNSLVSEIEERLHLVNKSSKVPALISLLKAQDWPQVLVFISARDDADAVARKLAKAGIAVAALHGEKDSGGAGAGACRLQGGQGAGAGGHGSDGARHPRGGTACGDQPGPARQCPRLCASHRPHRPRRADRSRPLPGLPRGSRDPRGHPHPDRSRAAAGRA